MVFIVEEETEPRHFSIHWLIHYCVDLVELLKTTQIVPIVVLLHSGEFPRQLSLSNGEDTYLSFRFIHCELARLPAQRYLDSGNIVARLNLPNGDGGGSGQGINCGSALAATRLAEAACP